MVLKRKRRKVRRVENGNDHGDNVKKWEKRYNKEGRRWEE